MAEPQRTRPNAQPDTEQLIEHDSDVILDFQPEEEPDAVTRTPTVVSTEPTLPPGGLRDPNRRLGRTAPLWFSFVAILAVVLFFVALSLRGGPETAPTIQATPGAPGGVAGPPVATVPATDTPPPPTPTAVPVWQPNQAVVVGNTDGQGIRLRAEPNINGLTYDIYQDGARFTIVEPGDPYERYPIENDGYEWYRLRDEAGLVGWTVRQYLLPVE